MAFFAMILGVLGILTTAMGVVTAVKAVPQLAGLDWTFWFAATMILLLGSIASAIGGRSEY